MDIKDLPGDALTGVPTIPAALGRASAWLISIVPLATAAAVAASTATASAAAAAVWPLGMMVALAVYVRMSEYSPRSLALAIESAPLWLACAATALMRAS